ncbi:hypothetical protein RMCBS344292_13885 [Rhizopus microsporus]|nr:hypothetical protein RMCBS344292_13885 [Rhizopus microsporus]
MIPTKENRDLAKWKLQSIGLAPTYTNETSAMEPLAIAATLQKKNPFKYMSYDDTPPSSPSESGVKRSYEQMSSSSESTDDYRVDITKEYVLDVLHALCLLKDPEDNEKYERAFLTNDDVWDVLKDFIDGLCDTFSPKQLAKWMANDGSWGQLERRQADGARQRGRQLHLLKSQYRGNAVDNVKNINSYRAFVHVDAEKWTIVGYARKSMTDEDDSTRQRLLNGMLTKLKTKLLCRKVFVSPCSSADMEFSKRDTSKRSLKFMESLKCDGTTQEY